MTDRSRQPVIADRRAGARTWLARALAALLALTLPGVAVGTGQDAAPRQSRVAGAVGEVATLPAAALQAKRGADIAPLPQTGWGLPTAVAAPGNSPGFDSNGRAVAARPQAHHSRPYDPQGPPPASV